MDLESALCQPIGGLMTHPWEVSIDSGEPAYPIFSCSLGDLSQISAFKNRNYGNSMEMSGAGGDIQPEVAKFRALAETLERYCSCVYDDSQFLWASAAELGDNALDLDSIPVCSEQELSNSRCPLIRPDKSQKIRWVKGVSLVSRRLKWVPAIMTCLYIPYLTDAERFWAPISTGCAIHQTYEQSLINAILEVIERDAISLTWLHRLDLPRIEVNPDFLSLDEQKFYKLTEDYPYFDTLYFDATTDVGIPVIYCVQYAPHNDKIRTAVMCTTELNPMEAFTKITREAASVRLALRDNAISNKPIDDFYTVTDGAMYMAHPSRVSGFDFLKASKQRKYLHDMDNLSSGNPKQDLQYLLTTLAKQGRDVIAVNLTTDEARRCGLYATRAIIPSLQPLSFVYRARYLGSERLYSAPLAMGYGVRTEEDINPLPQPFA